MCICIISSRKLCKVMAEQAAQLPEQLRTGHQAYTMSALQVSILASCFFFDDFFIAVAQGYQGLDLGWGDRIPQGPNNFFKIL